MVTENGATFKDEIDDILGFDIDSASLSCLNTTDKMSIFGGLSIDFQG